MTHNLLWLVVATLGNDVRVDALDQLKRRVFLKDFYLVDKPERQQHCPAVILIVDRAALAFESPDRSV